MNNHPSVYLGDAASMGVMAGALAGWLPSIAALLTIIWTLIRIIETDTVQKLLVKLSLYFLQQNATTSVVTVQEPDKAVAPQVVVLTSEPAPLKDKTDGS